MVRLVRTFRLSTDISRLFRPYIESGSRCPFYRPPFNLRDWTWRHCQNNMIRCQKYLPQTPRVVHSQEAAFPRCRCQQQLGNLPPHSPPSDTILRLKETSSISVETKICRQNSSGCSHGTSLVPRPNQHRKPFLTDLDHYYLHRVAWCSWSEVSLICVLAESFWDGHVCAGRR